MARAQTADNQVIETIVSGPDGANRQYICTGTAGYPVTTNGGMTSEVLTFLVGPTLERRQFHRAIGTATVSQQYFGFSFEGAANQIGAQYGVEITSVEADWDDESGQTEVRVEVRVTAAGLVGGATVAGSAYLQATHVRYWVTMLAELPV